MRPVALWDIDNCLSNDAWRIPFIDWSAADADARYAPYHLPCANDPLVDAHATTFHAVSLFADPIFFTARPELVRANTVWWLQQHLRVRNPTVLMRRAREFVPSVQLKQNMLDLLRNDSAPSLRVVAAFDDRQDIVDMYERNGIRALVLKAHDVCAYTNPNTQEKPSGI